MEALTLDLHTHLIPCVDDGSRGDVETVAMARGLAALGVRRALLTPHQFRCGNCFDAAMVESHAAHVRNLLDQGGVELAVTAAAEFCLGPAFLDALEQHGLFGFQHQGQAHLLAEFPLGQPFVGAASTATMLQREGFVPVLAHPERYDLPLSELEALRSAGWRLQINLPSLVARYGEAARRTAHALVANRWVDFVGSDLHRPGDLAALTRAHSVYRELRERVPA